MRSWRRSMGWCAMVLGALGGLAFAEEAAAPRLARNGGYLGMFLEEKDGTITIRRVHKGSGAEKAGFQAGDVVTRVNGRKVPHADALLKRLWGQRKLRIEVLREKKTIEIRTSTQALDLFPEVEDKAPLFTLTGKDGKTRHSLKAILAKGRPVVLVFGSFT